MTIDFCSNFVHGKVIIWEVQFWNKKRMPMLIKEHWDIENAPFWRCFMLYITRSNCKILVIETRENKNSTTFNTLCRTQTKVSSLIYGQKASSLLKIGTKFLDMVTKRQNRKDHSISAIFLIFSIFSNRNRRSLFHTKLMISWLQWLQEKVGCPSSLVSYSHFFNWQLNV